MIAKSSPECVRSAGMENLLARFVFFAWRPPVRILFNQQRLPRDQRVGRWQSFA